MAASCRKIVKERILTDMLGAVHDNTGGGWKVVVLDEFTTRILSSALKMSDILDCNVSVVEDLAKLREPLHQPAVYFIQPSPSSVARVLEDFGGPDGKGPIPGGSKGPGAPRQVYPTAHIFFSSPAPPKAIESIKGNERLIKCLKTLKEFNLEFLTIDSRTMVTDHPRAAEIVLSDSCAKDRPAVEKQVEAVCARLVTLFAALNEFPVIRYKASRAPEPGDPPGQALRGALPQLLATRLLERLSNMQRAGQLPPRETCDMLVLDRTYDPVAPFIHEWSYEALAYDLAELEGNIYRYQAESQAGKADSKEVLLDEHDEMWVELRHLFIAEVYSSLGQKMKDFQSKNKAAKAAGALGSKGNEPVSALSLKQLLSALPQYRDLLSKLGVHIALSSDLKSATNARGLTEVGELEQDLVLGEKASKDLLAFMAEHGAHMDVYDKVRLVACYLATHPGKLDITKRLQWQKTAGLTGEDMAALCGGLARLGVKVMETPAAAETKGGFFSRGTKVKPAKATRSKRGEDEEQYALNRFNPLMLDIVEDLAQGKLGLEEYPYIRPPSDPTDTSQAAASARTARSGLNWARQKDPSDGAAGAGGGRRLVVFVLGGVTRGEMRVIHQLSKSLQRDIILGSTSVDSAKTFVDLLYNIIPSEAGDI